MTGNKILTGILGGSFNPVHYGHLSLARNIVERGIVDEMWLSLSPRNPFKDENMLMPDSERLEKLREAVKDIKGVEACDIELGLPRPSYTIDALECLRDSNTDRIFTLVIGDDNLERFTSWKNWESILENFGLIVYPRHSVHPTLPEQLSGWKDKITLLSDMPLYDISSTQIRESLKKP